MVFGIREHFLRFGPSVHGGATSGRILLLAHISTVSNMSNSTVSASVFRFHVYFLVFSFKNHHFRQLTPVCATSGCIRHVAHISTLVYMCTSPKTASVFLYHGISTGFLKKNAIFRILASIDAILRHFRLQQALGAH